MKVLKLRDFIIAFIIAGVALICGSFFDKSISQTLYADFNHTGLATFVAAYLLLPYYFIIYFTIFSFAFSLKPHVHIVLRIILYAVCAYLMVFTGYRIYTQLKELNKFYGEIGNAIHIAFFVLVCVVSSLLVYLLIARKKVDKMSLIKTGTIVLIIFTFVTFVQLSFKEIWSRPRPLYVYKHIDEYKDWWQLQPYMSLQNKDYVSFPSGHSISGTILMCSALVYSTLFKKFNNAKSRTYIFYILLFVAFIMGFSRIVSGQHFLTDNCFGILFSLTIFYITMLIADKIIKNPIAKE